MRRLAALLIPLALSTFACAVPEEVGAEVADVTEQAPDVMVELRTGFGDDPEIQLLVDGAVAMTSGGLDADQLEGLYERIQEGAADAEAYDVALVDPEQLEGIWKDQERGKLLLSVGDVTLKSAGTMALDELTALRNGLIASSEQGRFDFRDLVNLCSLTLNWQGKLVYEVDGDGNGSREFTLEGGYVEAEELAELIPTILERSQIDEAWQIVEDGSRFRISVTDAEGVVLLGASTFSGETYAGQVAAQAAYMLGEQQGCELQL